MTDTLPKIDLHCHLEGTASPELIQQLARLNDIPLPEGLLSDHGAFLWTDFVDFLRTYDLASSCIRTAEDYRLVTYEYLKECAAQGGIYSEFF
ncbi:MAG: adenosine deaminase, partial [Gammaproteobacteria bacterium]|nr:adenosine deaminase [Gammaproteobacteria bacterium]